MAQTAVVETNSPTGRASHAWPAATSHPDPTHGGPRRQPCSRRRVRRSPNRGRDGQPPSIEPYTSVRLRSAPDGTAYFHWSAVKWICLWVVPADQEGTPLWLSALPASSFPDESRNSTFTEGTWRSAQHLR